jgi:hypothetical protein
MTRGTEARRREAVRLRWKRLREAVLPLLEAGVPPHKIADHLRARNFRPPEGRRWSARAVEGVIHHLRRQDQKAIERTVRVVLGEDAPEDLLERARRQLEEVLLPLTELRK